MVSTFAYDKSCASAVAFIFAMHCLENEEFSKFKPQESKPEEYTPAPLGVPEGNLWILYRDRAHISGNAAARKRTLCKQSDNDRGEWRVSSSTPKMRRRRRRLAFRQVLSLYVFLKSRWNSHSCINLNKSKTCFRLSVDFVDTLIVLDFPRLIFYM